MANKYMNRLVDKKSKLVAIVGRPNVGKSSLFNRIIGYKKAIVCDKEGTTRDRVMSLTSWQGRSFWLMDTAGMLRRFEKDSIEESAMRQVEHSIAQADIILFVVDAKVGLTNEDLALWNQLRSVQDRIIFVVNKVDSPKLNQSADSFFELGVKRIDKVSAINGSGVGDLLDFLVDRLGNLSGEQDGEETGLQVCILGRPNVGKSTLANSMCGFDRMAVSEQSGTTRDVGEVKINYGEDNFWLIDTAGLLSPGRYRKKGVDRDSYARALAQARNSNIAVVVLDGSEGITRMDMSIVSTVCDLGLGVVLFVNKWDLIDTKEESQERYIRQMQRKLEFAYWVPVVFGSAKNSENINILKKKIVQVGKKYISQIDQKDLSEFVQVVNQTNFQINRLGISKIRQVSTSPPKFEVRYKNKKSLSCNNERLLERLVRDYFNLAGVAIKVVWK